MSDDSSFDLSSAAAMLFVIVVALALSIHLIPALLQTAFQVRPGLIILWLIVAVLRGMAKRLLD